MQQASKNEQAATSSRRGFFQTLAGALGLAFLNRAAPAESAPSHQPAAQSSSTAPQSERSPGPDWDRVVSSRPDAVGGWRNRTTGDFMTDWIPRADGDWLIDTRLIENAIRKGHFRLVTMRCSPCLGHPYRNLLNYQRRPQC